MTLHDVSRFKVKKWKSYVSQHYYTVMQFFPIFYLNYSPASMYNQYASNVLVLAAYKQRAHDVNVFCGL